MPYNVSAGDIADRWRPLSVAEEDVATVLLASAEVKLDMARPRLRPAVEEGKIPERFVVDILCDMVQRVMRNPDVLRGQNLTSDGGIGVTFGTNEDTYRAQPRLKITEIELAEIDLALVHAGGVPRVGSVRLRAWGDPGSSSTGVLP